MEQLAVNKLINFHPNTMVDLRNLYNLDKPGQMDQSVDILHAWIQKQDHFLKKDFSREYLERLIIQLKGSVERAKSQLDKICTLRTIMPKFFDVSNPRDDFKEIHEYLTYTLLPNLTKEHYRIFLLNINTAGPHSTRNFFLIYLFCVTICEYIKLHDYCDGIISICDLRGVQITDLVTEINLTDMQQMATIAMEGYKCRLKSINFISTSKAIDLLVKIFKQILSSKVANRIHVYKTLEDLYEFVPRSLLPKDYGGDEKSLKELYEQCLDALSSNEHQEYLKEIRNARTDESRRSVSTFNEKYLGLAGTFRTLNVD